jgi:excinuclease ABC subunit A
VLYGSGKEQIRFKYLNEKGTRFERTHAFEGIIPNLERRYRETDSMAVREELAKYLNNKPCPECGGMRLRREARHVFVGGRNISDLSRLSLINCRDFFNLLQLTGQKAQVGEKILKEITARLSFLINVGLDYLSLDRSAETLSGGEAQRIRLASQIGSGLTGVMYVLDEPSIGLHQRDNSRLLETLTRLRDLGNTVIVVEHDLEAIESADYVVDMGPGAGEHGGRVVAEGTPAQVAANILSMTGAYLSGRREHRHPRQTYAAQCPARTENPRRQRQQPQAGRPADSGRPADLHHRRLRLGQVDPDQRHAVCRRRAPPLWLGGRTGRRTARSKASSSSTR